MRLRGALATGKGRAAAGLLLTLVGGGGALGIYRFAPRSAPAGQPALVRLDPARLGELKGAFNAASDRVRVVAMFSPT